MSAVTQAYSPLCHVNVHFLPLRICCCLLRFSLICLTCVYDWSLLKGKSALNYIRQKKMLLCSLWIQSFQEVAANIRLSQICQNWHILCVS